MNFSLPDLLRKSLLLCLLSLPSIAFRLEAKSTESKDNPTLYRFKDGSDGANPSANLLISTDGTTLYGTASQGGDSGYGTIYSLNSDGSNFQTLYSFSGGSDGANPYSSLLFSTDGASVYGTTYQGGASNAGAIFAINTDGTGFTNLYSFTGGNDGANPSAPLILSTNDATLYGIANQGGASNMGTVFAINTDGTGFTNLYSFTGENDGGNPSGPLLLGNNGTTLYGTASQGGTSNAGTVFAINTDGTGFTNLYSFGGGNDGAAPDSGLLLLGDTLYGTTSSGGRSFNGVIYAVNTNGGAFQSIYSFKGGKNGANPFSGLVLSHGSLVGTTYEVYPTTTFGTVFSIPVPGPVYTITVSAFPPSGGSVSGSTTVPSGTKLSVKSKPKKGYEFVNWTVGSNIVRTTPDFSFNVTASASLVANFAKRVTLKVSSSPSNGGILTGDGDFASGSSGTVTAKARRGYSFLNWTDGLNVVSTAPTYSFTIPSNNTVLTANFVRSGY